MFESEFEFFFFFFDLEGGGGVSLELPDDLFRSDSYLKLQRASCVDRRGGIEGSGRERKREGGWRMRVAKGKSKQSKEERVTTSEAARDSMPFFSRLSFSLLLALFACKTKRERALEREEALYARKRARDRARERESAEPRNESSEHWNPLLTFKEKRVELKKVKSALEKSFSSTSLFTTKKLF